MNEEQEFDYEYEYDDKGEIVYYAVRPNKTQLKKDLAVLFVLSEEMSNLSAPQIKNLELPENIHKAVMEVSGMPHKGARKRLLKYITGQLNKIDVEPILENLARMKNKSVHSVREHHIVERWRDRLIKGGNEALTAFLNENPDADRQQLRQLLRNIQKEAETSKPPKSFRLLYRYLKGVFNFDEDVDYDNMIVHNESEEIEDELGEDIDYDDEYENEDDED
jgi:ribosome-associated protein